MSKVTGHVANFALSEPSLPPNLMTDAHAALIDFAACLIAGYETDTYRAVAESELVDPAGQGQDIRGSSPTQTAFLAGVAAHALDFDDSLHPTTAHPSCVLAPVLLALARHSSKSGTDLLTSYAIGIECMARLAEALGPQHYLAGWHTTSTVGTVAAAAVAARLLDLTFDQTCNALAVSASMAGGLRVNIGSQVKPVHAGMAAAHGVTAALLARAGVRGDPDALGGKLGFLDVFGPGGSPDPLLGLGEGLGVGYHLGIKPYACCGEAIGAIEAGIWLRKRIDPQQITRVQVRTNRMAREVLRYDNPQTESETRFSLQFCLARALVTGAFPLRADYPALSQDPQLTRIMNAIEWEVDPAIAGREFGAEVCVHLQDAEAVSHRVDVTLGWHERRLSRAMQREKFLDCTSMFWTQARASNVFSVLEQLPMISARDFVSSLSDASSSGNPEAE
jgi:2-methylcitrate dehydratase PrpD